MNNKIQYRYVIVGPDDTEFDGLTVKGEPIWNIEGGLTFMEYNNALIRKNMLHKMGWTCAYIKRTLLQSVKSLG